MSVNTTITHFHAPAHLSSIATKKNFKYKYLSYKYNISHDNWYKNVSHLIGKVKIKLQQDFQSRNKVQTLVELCAIRDGLISCDAMSYSMSYYLVSLFNKCSKPVLLELCRSFCNVFYCPYFWTQYKKTTFSKIRVAYNNVYRKILGVSRRSSASGMFVCNDIPNFEAFLRKSIYSFTTRLSFSSNKLICAIEQSWTMKSVIWKSWEEKMYTYVNYDVLFCISSIHIT